MMAAELFKQYLEHLFIGKRCEARELIFGAMDRGITSSKLLKQIIWPAMEQVDKLYRQNEISRITEHMATRINRMIADQLHSFLARRPKTGRRVIIVCGAGEVEELGAQMTADLFEADGWSVWFLGSGVPNDEILQFAGKIKPDVLLIHGTKPEGVPAVRKLIALFREVGSCPDMQILVMGGVFNRADGLAEEVKADLFSANVQEALRAVAEHPVRIPRPDVPEPGRRRKRRPRVVPAAMRRGRAVATA